MRINNGQLDLRCTHCGPGWLQNVLCILKRELLGRREANRAPEQHLRRKSITPRHMHSRIHVYWFLIVEHASQVSSDAQTMAVGRGLSLAIPILPLCVCACVCVCVSVCVLLAIVSAHSVPTLIVSNRAHCEPSFIARVMLSSVPEGSFTWVETISFNFPASYLKIDDIDWVLT